MVNSGKHVCTDIKTILAQKGLDCNNESWSERLEQVSSGDVANALADSAGVYSFEKLLALISPAAAGHLEQMAQSARVKPMITYPDPRS